MIKNAKQKLHMSSLSEEKFLDLLRESQDFLKTKLQPCVNENNIVEYWTCGTDHFDPPPYHDPFKNIIKFCAKKNLDWHELKERIEQYSGITIFCECFIVNRLHNNEV
jgi:hypothetical protein